MMEITEDELRRLVPLEKKPPLECKRTCSPVGGGCNRTEGEYVYCRKDWHRCYLSPYLDWSALLAKLNHERGEGWGNLDYCEYMRLRYGKKTKQLRDRYEEAGSEDS